MRRWVLSGIVIAAACGGTREIGPITPSEAPTYASAHFVFHYTSADVANIADTAATLEREYERIVADLGSEPMPTVHVQLYTDNAAMIAATVPIAGIVPPGTSGLVTAVDRIHLMSPDLPGWGGRERMLSNLIHEFAHCVSMRVNGSIPNNPRWLWEAIAVWESRQAVDPRTLPYMTALQPPAFSRFATFDNSLIYQLGYTIAEFVVDRGGPAALRALLRNNGDLGATLGLSGSAVETEWFAFVRARYHF